MLGKKNFFQIFNGLTLLSRSDCLSICVSLAISRFINFNRHFENGTWTYNSEASLYCLCQVLDHVFGTQLGT